MAKDEEDYTEVEMVDEDDDEPKKYQRKSKRRDSDDEDDSENKPSKKKKILVFVVILIIVLAIIFAVFFLNPAVADVIVDNPIETTDGDGIVITAHVIPEGGSSVNGDADLEIYYEGDKVYSDKITINRDEGRKEVPYNKFVMGNEKYEIKVKFSGKSATSNFILHENFDWAVVEHINVTADLNPPEKDSDVRLRVNARVIDESNNNPLAPPKKANVEITIAYENGASQSYNQDILYPDAYCEFNEYRYLNTGSGNYTITAKLTNHYVKDSSEFKTIEIEEPVKKFLNIFPVAEAGDDVNEQIRRPPFGTGEVTINFDGSDSWNDGTIRYYLWDFDYKDEDGNEYPDFTVDAVGISVDNTYNSAGTYDVGLRIIGNYAGYFVEGEPLYEETIDVMQVDISII
jgi:hypothetical protein